MPNSPDGPRPKVVHALTSSNLFRIEAGIYNSIITDRQ